MEGSAGESGQMVSMAPVSLAPSVNMAPASASSQPPSGTIQSTEQTHLQSSGGGGEQSTGWCRACLTALMNCTKDAAHPVTCLFHGLFKALALVTYVIGGNLFPGMYVYIFIFSTILAALDFWTVKNVTGRLLVGLRWWNNVKEDGSSEWVFESNPEENLVNSSDRMIFWSLLMIWPVLWLILLLINLFSLSLRWVLLDSLLAVFAVANLAGYWKCSEDAKKRAREMGSWAQGQALRSMVSGAMGF
mmetsp:Transcript_13426/g.31570  ORF Transcript_13426/g.31570 Transcript_13426/m.31570 type:complete len:246 (-) Transcript_13426:86-823(-)